MLGEKQRCYGQRVLDQEIEKDLGLLLLSTCKLSISNPRTRITNLIKHVTIIFRSPKLLLALTLEIYVFLTLSDIKDDLHISI